MRFSRRGKKREGGGVLQAHTTRRDVCCSSVGIHFKISSDFKRSIVICIHAEGRCAQFFASRLFLLPFFLLLLLPAVIAFLRSSSYSSLLSFPTFPPIYIFAPLAFFFSNSEMVKGLTERWGKRSLFCLLLLPLPLCLFLVLISFVRRSI